MEDTYNPDTDKRFIDVNGIHDFKPRKGKCGYCISENSNYRCGFKS